MMPVRWMFAALAALSLFAAGVPAVAQTLAGVKRVQVAANTTPVAVCSGSCILTGITVFSNSANVAYVKLYATPAASVVAGTTVVTDQVLIPASTSGAGAVIPLPGSQATGGGVRYPSGLSIVVTTGYADSDTTAPAANAYIVTLYTK